MSSYLAFELIVIAVLLLLSLRVVWLKLLKPALQRPKSACGSGCNQCSVKH